MSEMQLHINETILDESENESDIQNGKIYSLYEPPEIVKMKPGNIEDQNIPNLKSSDLTIDDKYEKCKIRQSEVLYQCLNF